MKVTTIPTMYRDASNYKAYGMIEVTGELTDAHKATLKGALRDGEFYVPRQLGLDHHGAGAWSSFPCEDDHGWHALQLDELAVTEHDPNARPLRAANTEDCGSVDEFVAKVLTAAQAGWDPTLEED